MSKPITKEKMTQDKFYTFCRHCKEIYLGTDQDGVRSYMSLEEAQETLGSFNMAMGACPDPICQDKERLRPEDETRNWPMRGH